MGSNDELLAKIRAQVNRNEGTRINDPHKFTPSSLRPKEEKSWYFIVLPGVEKGDDVNGGKKAVRGMDGLPYIKTAQHWLEHEKKLLECPRVMLKEKCAMCDTGFSLLDGVEDQAQRSAIRDKFLPRENVVINAYFPPIDGQPDELKGKVMWFPVGQRKVYNKFFECLNRDKPASGSLKKQAYGIFWPFNDAESGQENVCYIYEIHATRKAGTKYNDYDGSDFLVESRGPITNFIPSSTTYQEILAQRHDLWSKYREPDGARIQAAANDIVKKIGEPVTSDDADSGGDAPAEPATVTEKHDVRLSMTKQPEPATPAATAPVQAKEAATSASPGDDPDLAAMVARLTGKAKK
jgi:hypothetical protein